MQNLWEPFGLQSTPFFDQPLEPTTQGVYPITLYVPRGPEQRILNRIASSRNSVSLVESLPGGGKTTFLNYLRYVSSENGYLVSPSHVRITSGFGYREFALETLTNILRPLVNNRSENLRERATRHQAIMEAVDLVNQASRGGGGWGVEVHAEYQGVGGGLGLSRDTPAREAPPIEHARLYSMTSAVAKAARDDLGFKGTIVHVNNLELAAIGDAAWPSVLFNDVRDYLQIDGVHFVIGASRGFYAAHIMGHPRVSPIIADPLDLVPLQAVQVKQLLEKRYEKIAISGRSLIQPVEWAAVEQMYKTFNGDLRAMFASLEAALEQRLTIEARPLAFAEAVALLRPQYAETTLRDLPKSAEAAVQRLSTLPRPFTQSDFAKLSKKSQPRVSQIFSELQRLGIIVQTGASKPYPYDFSGKAKIALGLTS